MRRSAVHEDGRDGDCRGGDGRGRDGRDGREEPPSVTFRLVRPLLLRLHTEGVDVPAWLRECGVPPGLAFEPDARIPEATLARMWRRAEEITGDRLLAVHTLAAVDLRMIDLRGRMSEYVLVHVFANSADVASGLTRFARFYSTGLPGGRLVVERSARGLEVSFALGGSLGRSRAAGMAPGTDGEGRVDGLVEYLVGTVARMVAATTEPPVAPAEVWFAHAGPADASAHEQALRAPVRFGAGGDGLRYDAASARAPLQTADALVLAMAERRAVRELEAIEQSESAGSIVARTRARIAAELRGGNPTSHAVATQLGLSPRTLARRLAEQGTSFKGLLDDVRKKHAEEHLADGRLTVAEVSTLLGFADASAFTRAYKRWFGAAPGERKHRPG